MTIQIAAVGCSGPVAAHIIHGFLEQKGVTVRILARNPDVVAQRYPQATVMAGSMGDPDRVAQAVATSDAAFLITPMGMNNDPTLEVAVAAKTIEGAKRGGLKHLIYASVLQSSQDPSSLTGVGILDAKRKIETLIAESGIPCTILRCGSYMEDVFDPRIHLLKMGIFLFPINRQRQFSYTAQRDIPKFIVQELYNNPVNGSIDFIEPEVHSILQVERLLSDSAGFRIRTTPKMPVFYIFYCLLPIFNWMKHRFSSVIPLMQHFDKYGYSGNSQQLSNMFPKFKMTSLSVHLSQLFDEGAVSKKEN
jgi:uncharacterized protein YbjT (DUF2867 family)